MGLLTPADREFAVLPVGWIRDRVILANFRAGLRTRINPQTGVLFTEEEIALATRPGSRWYREATGIDDYGQGRQRNALWLVDQIRADRASSRWLKEYHGEPRGLFPLDPTGGSGLVKVTGVPGTLVVGSTTIGAPGTYTAKDPEGSVFQVYFSGELDADGEAKVTLAGVTTGSHTNIKNGTTLTWIERDPNMDPKCLVVDDDFRGGTDIETDAEYLARYNSRLRYKPGAGNDPQMNEWGRSASNAIENAFVYSTAFHSGSALIAITAKRAGGTGPLSRFPGTTILSAATSYLVPPLSPVVPARSSYVVVVSPQSEPVDMAVKLALARGTASGWTDVRPFPSYHSTTPHIETVSGGGVTLQIDCPGDATLPGQSSGATLSGADAPNMMIWDDTVSRFVKLNVDSVEHLGGTLYEVTLLGIPDDFPPTVGMFVSPDMSRRDSVSGAVENYFDKLGPGNLFDPDTDVRGARCVRFPEFADEFPFRAGSTVTTRITEALGGTGADAVLEDISQTEPSYPSDLMDGPNMLTLGKLGIYEI